MEELINVQKQEERAKKSLKKLKPVIFHGDSGIGKTSLARKIAKDLGYKIQEFNISEERDKESYEELERKVRTRTIDPCLFLFDEIDGYKNYWNLNKLLKNSIHPIICTCNELWRIPRYIQENCDTIKFYNPKKADIIQYMKDHNIKGDYTKVSYDVRNSVISVASKTDPYKELNNFEKVEAILKGRYEGEWDNKLYIWILDNIFIFYQGYDIIHAIKLLELADMYNKPEILKFLPQGKSEKPRYPYYFTRAKVHKEEKKKDDVKYKIKRANKRKY